MMKKRIAALATAGPCFVDAYRLREQTGELEGHLPVGTVWCRSNGKSEGCSHVPGLLG